MRSLARYCIGVLLIAVLAFAALPVLGAKPAQASGTVYVDVYDDVVEIYGEGFNPGALVTITLTSPSGEVFTLEQTVVADTAGTFATEVPTWQFRAAGIGYWQFDFADDFGNFARMKVLIT
jgi:hypothetical protein